MQIERDSNPLFLSVEGVLEIHRQQIEQWGGDPGLRDLGLLESAVMAPQNKWAYDEEADIFDLAASYCFHLASNHPFVDGNKRTGLGSALDFLWLNGLDPVRRGTNAEGTQVTDDLLAGAVLQRINGETNDFNLADLFFLTVGIEEYLDAVDAAVELGLNTVHGRKFNSQAEFKAYAVDVILSSAASIIIEKSQKYFIKPHRFEEIIVPGNEFLISRVMAKYQAEFGMTISPESEN